MNGFESIIHVCLTHCFITFSHARKRNIISCILPDLCITWSLKMIWSVSSGTVVPGWENWNSPDRSCFYKPIKVVNVMTMISWTCGKGSAGAPFISLQHLLPSCSISQLLAERQLVDSHPVIMIKLPPQQAWRSPHSTMTRPGKTPADWFNYSAYGSSLKVWPTSHFMANLCRKLTSEVQTVQSRVIASCFYQQKMFDAN